MKTGFTSQEKRSIAGLSTVLAFRMLGLSMIIPVFSVYAIGLPGSSPILAGIAFGIYGLTQAFFQIPFGYLSDRLGRKPIVAAGLLLFGFGSVICALTQNIYILIIGRFLQGGGAIASACFAWISDLTDTSHRNVAMAFMGISIGGGIVMGMIFGPVIGGIMGVPFLFWVAAGLSLGGVYITLRKLEEAPGAGNVITEHHDFSLNPIPLIKLSSDPDLIRLNITGFLVNIGMIVTFFNVPLKLAEKFEMGELWKIYIPLAIFSGISMMLTSRKADKGAARGVISGALAALAIAFGILFLSKTMGGVLAGFSIFFSAFSVLEATLPAAVSKLADQDNKGAIIGMFNLCQFSGTFVGGMLAGYLSGDAAPVSFMILTVASVIAMGLILSSKKLSEKVEDSG